MKVAAVVFGMVALVGYILMQLGILEVENHNGTVVARVNWNS